MAGIGHPPRFFATLKPVAHPGKVRSAGHDHQTLAPADVQALVGEGQTGNDGKRRGEMQCFAEDNWWSSPLMSSGDKSDKLLEHITSLVREGTPMQRQ